MSSNRLLNVLCLAAACVWPPPAAAMTPQEIVSALLQPENSTGNVAAKDVEVCDSRRRSR